MKQMRWIMNYHDVIEEESKWLLGTASKVTRKRDDMCMIVIGESERISVLLS